MKIFDSVVTNLYLYKANFKGNIIEDCEVYNMCEGQQYTDAVREHLFPNLNTYITDGQKSEREMEMMLYDLCEKTLVDNELLNSLGLNKLEAIGNNSYRGSMIRKYNIKNMQKLKEAGIKHIVDLEGYPETKEECKKLGLDYMYFEHIDASNVVFEPSRYWDGYRREYHKKSPEFFEKCKKVTDSIVKLVQTMQKGNVYIGCSLGTDATDCALLLDYLYNPMADHDSYADSDKNYYCRNHYFSPRHWTEREPRISYLWDKFTSEDFQKMGWKNYMYPWCDDLYQMKERKILHGR